MNTCNTFLTLWAITLKHLSICHQRKWGAMAKFGVKALPRSFLTATVPYPLLPRQEIGLDDFAPGGSWLPLILVLHPSLMPVRDSTKTLLLALLYFCCQHCLRERRRFPSDVTLKTVSCYGIDFDAREFAIVVLVIIVDFVFVVIRVNVIVKDVFVVILHVFVLLSSPFLHYMRFQRSNRQGYLWSQVCIQNGCKHCVFCVVDGEFAIAFVDLIGLDVFEDLVFVVSFIRWIWWFCHDIRRERYRQSFSGAVHLFLVVDTVLFVPVDVVLSALLTSLTSESLARSSLLSLIFLIILLLLM